MTHALVKPSFGPLKAFEGVGSSLLLVLKVRPFRAALPAAYNPVVSTTRNLAWAAIILS